MRDALVAGITLNIFNSHCDRVIMANLAQTVNVLQAVIHTDGEKMIKTPTYHVFDLYKGHQGARLIESGAEARHIGTGGYSVPDLHISASQTDDGEIRATLVSLSPHAAQDICCQLRGGALTAASARVLTGKMDEHNDFDAAFRVKPQPFDKIKIAGGELHFQIPPCSVMEIVIQAVF
jgi:alpha-N-arabinofuranosidase